MAFLLRIDYFYKRKGGWLYRYRYPLPFSLGRQSHPARGELTAFYL
jgi:hypothetical protein